MVFFTFSTDITLRFLFLGNLDKCVLNPQFHNLSKISIHSMISVNVQSYILTYASLLFIDKKEISPTLLTIYTLLLPCS